MIKLIHAADFHLDSAFRAMPPEKAGLLRQKQRELLDKLVELVNSEHADLVLLSGDLFDSGEVYPDTLYCLKRALSECCARVFIAPGNHDPYTISSPWETETWPDNVHIFKKNTIESVYLEDLGCQVYGAGFTSAQAPSLLEGFRVEDGELLNLMVLHGDATQPNSYYNPVRKQQIEDSGLDYLALGHIHKGTDPLHLGKTTCAWPGCPMGRGFDELGEKGVLVVTAEKSQITCDFRPLADYRYEIVSVEAGDDPLAAIENALPEDTARDCYRIILTGEADTPDCKALHDALSERFFSLTVLDRTTPKLDPWASCEEDSLKGLTLQLLKQDFDAAEEKDRDLILQAARLTVSILDGREVAE